MLKSLNKGIVVCCFCAIIFGLYSVCRCERSKVVSLGSYRKLYKAIEGGEAFLFFNEKLALRRLEKPADPFAATEINHQKKEFSYDLCRATYQGTPDYARMSGGLVEQILLQDVSRISSPASGVPLHVKGKEDGESEIFWYLVNEPSLGVPETVTRISDFAEQRGSGVEVSELFEK